MGLEQENLPKVVEMFLVEEGLKVEKD